MKKCKPVLSISKRSLTVAVAAMLLAVSALAQDSETVLYKFTGGSDGAIGGFHLVADSAGNLYGTTFSGGNKSTECGVFAGIPGCGVVFMLAPTKDGPWKETVLHTFTGGADGAVPVGGVILDSEGNLYGTTLFGGDEKSANCQAAGIYAAGCGVVYKLTHTPQGTWYETVLYKFKGGADGSEPWDPLILDASGNLYGTANIGGNDSCVYGCGVVFKLTPSDKDPWKESVLYSFSGGTDGGFPYSGLTFDSQGNLYGTTVYGGDTSVSCNGVPGCGVVFQLTPTSSGPWTETVLHRFTAGSDGGYPLFGVTLDAGGNVYGTTQAGGDTTGPNCLGTIPGCGLVFELSLRANGTWKEKVLYTFTGGSDGSFGVSPLIFDSSGDLYGMTGGDFVPSCQFTTGCGGVFELTPAGQGPWTENVLYAFTGHSDGSLPESNLLLDSSGSLYGMTEGCGHTFKCAGKLFGGEGCGVVFELMP